MASIGLEAFYLISLWCLVDQQVVVLITLTTQVMQGSNLSGKRQRNIKSAMAIPTHAMMAIRESEQLTCTIVDGDNFCPRHQATNLLGFKPVLPKVLPKFNGQFSLR